MPTALLKQRIFSHSPLSQTTISLENTVKAKLVKINILLVLDSIEKGFKLGNYINTINKRISRAVDFFRISNNPLSELTYHHIGIYAFTKEALLRYVGLKRSKKELDRKLEQLRALENEMNIDVGFISEPPLSVDSEEDLKNIKKIMEKNVKN